MSIFNLEHREQISVWGKVVLYDERGNILAEAYNVVLRQGVHRMIDKTFSTIRDRPATTWFLDRVSCSNGSQIPDWDDTEMHGTIMYHAPIISTTLVQTTDIRVLSRFTIPAGTVLQGHTLSELGLRFDDGLLFSKLLLQPGIFMDTTTVITGDYILGHPLVTGVRIFDHTFDPAFE